MIGGTSSQAGPTESCTIFIGHPFKRIELKIEFQAPVSECLNGNASGRQTVTGQPIGSPEGTTMTVTSTFVDGRPTGQTAIRSSFGHSFDGTMDEERNSYGRTVYRDTHVEEGHHLQGTLITGVITGTQSTGRNVTYFIDGQIVPESQYQASARSSQSYAYTLPPAPVTTQSATSLPQSPKSRSTDTATTAPIVAPPPQPAPARQTAQRRRSSDDGEECTIEPPAELRGMAISTQGECEGDTFSGKATFTLPTGKVQYIVPYRRGRVTGAMTAYFPDDRMTFTGSFNGIVPNVGLMEKPLGNGTFAIAEYSGGRLVSQRTEQREPGFGEQLLGTIVRDVVLPQVAGVIDQQANKIVDDAINGPERRRERRRIQAGETAQREAQQAQERQNAENVRLANEANERLVAQRAAERQQAENERRDREAARVAQQAESDRLYAERQAQSQREYAERQAQNERDQAERERVRQVEADQRQAERDAASRTRQVAQNEPAPFVVTTQPPVFGGTTGAPVVGTNPPIDPGVPAPTVGTNPPRNELPPPVDLTPTIRTPDVPPPLPSGTPLPDLRPTFNEPSPPPPTTLPDLRPTLGDPLPSGQDLRPSFPSQPAEPVQPPTRNDTLGSGSTNSQPATAPSYSQPTRTTQQVSSLSVPSVPTGLYPTATGELALPIPLGWNSVRGATHYQIAIRDQATNQFVVDSETTATSITVRNFTLGRTYVWDVAACNSSGCSQRSANGSFRTGYIIPSSTQTQTATRTPTSPTRPRPSDAGNWSSNFVRDAFDAAGDGTQKCAIALAQQTGESVEAAFQLITNAGGWQSLANSAASSVWNMVRHPILSLQAAWNGLTGQVTGVRDAVNAGNSSLACQRAVQLSGTVIGAAEGAAFARSSLSNLRRVSSQGNDVTRAAVARTENQTPATRRPFSLAEYRAHHDRAVAKLQRDLDDQGYTAFKEVSFNGNVCQIDGRCRADLIVHNDRGGLVLIEVKTGNASLSVNQSEIYPQIRDGNAIPVGRVARELGLRPGVALKNQGYPNGIPTLTYTYPGLS
jgi:hypothetical protein